MSVRLDDTLISRLDRLISELILVTGQDQIKELDDADLQTLKHHAEDMESAAKLVNSRQHSEAYSRQEARRKK